MRQPLSKAKQTLLRKLARRKTRDAEGLFVAEGVRIAEELARHSIKVEFLVSLEEPTERRSAETFLRRVAAISKIDADEYTLEPEAFREFSDTQASQGLLAVCRKPAPAEDEPNDNLLVLDNIRDPGNLGTCLRSAAAFGVKRISLINGCVDVWSSKVVRASMGGLFAPLSIWQESDAEALARAKTRGAVLALDAKPDLPGYFASVKDASGAKAVVVGGETEALSAVWDEIGVTKVAIHQSDAIDSLNAAMAATLACHGLWQNSGNS